jgi:tetrahydromethanopterin S-methyltransferase subunit G
MLMAVMMTPRETWTDQRLDDLNRKVDDGFDQVDKRFDRVEGDIRELRGDVKDLRGEMNGRFDSLNRTLIVASVGGNAAIIAALIGVNAF